MCGNMVVLIFCLTVKILPNEIDKVISAEIPDSTIDNKLFEVVTKNIIHGPSMENALNGILKSYYYY